MATQNGADALKIDGVVGRLEAGLFADVAIYAVDEGRTPTAPSSRPRRTTPSS